VGLHIYALIIQLKVIMIPWFGFSAHILFYCLFCALAIISHSRCQYTDPGAVPSQATSIGDPLISLVSDSVIDPRDMEKQTPAQKCEACRVVKPARAHHCSACSRCIIRMDHHCPWVNNCVAMLNQKYFLLFLIYTHVCCLYSAALLIARFITCNRDSDSCTVGGAEIVFGILNFVEAMLFGIFTLIMFVDQLMGILENTPAIDRMQHRRNEKKPKYECLKMVMGEGFSWRWFLPLGRTPKLIADFQLELQAERPVTPLPPAAASTTRVNPVTSTLAVPRPIAQDLKQQ